MKWFKHDTDASQDAKIKKLLIRYGVTGYAIYFHCLELIAGNVSETNLTFELEHDSEIIADNLRIKGTQDRSGISIVEEIMRFIVEIGLFEQSGDKIFCFKLLKRLDNSMVSKRFRKLITQAKESHDIVMTKSCISHDKVMLEENRREENRQDQKRIVIAPVSPSPEPSKIEKKSYSEFDIMLTDQEYHKLTDRFGAKATDSAIESAGGWLRSNGKQKKDHYSFVLNWMKRDVASGKVSEIIKPFTTAAPDIPDEEIASDEEVAAAFAKIGKLGLLRNTQKAGGIYVGN